ncbi:MAG: DUF4344 domain-containing metallopeptidase [Pyrinomonadaceae bacterium]
MKIKAIRLFVYITLTVAFAATQLIGQAVTKPTATPGRPPMKNSLDKGDFKVGFSPVTKARTPKKEMPKDEKETLQEVAVALNSLIALPHDVYLNLDTCGEPNAFYNPETSEITMCYEYLDDFETSFKTITKVQAKVDDMVSDAFIQVLFHELGHCLIDVWDLPATGREEDAVDQLAMILMLDGSPEGQQSAFNASLLWEIASRSEKRADMLFWDEHSFSKTRFFDMICLVYGSNPEKNAGMVGPNKLPVERAERCETEYKRAERAWLRLIEPYIIK